MVKHAMQNYEQYYFEFPAYFYADCLTNFSAVGMKPK